MRSRTRLLAEHYLTLLFAKNPGFAEFLFPFVNVCASYALLANGISRRNLLTSNPCEQWHSAFDSFRDSPIIDLCVAYINKMADYGYQRGTAARARLQEGHFLVPKATLLHTEVIAEARKLKVFINAEDEQSVVACVTTSGRSNSTHTVTIAINDGRPVSGKCCCKFSEENCRPCRHVIAVVLTCTTVALDAWDPCWFGPEWTTQTWDAQYSVYFKRGSGMRPNDFERSPLVPAQVSRRPGRSKKVPYVPSGTTPRLCTACKGRGHFASNCPRPDIDNIVQHHRRATQKAVLSMIDLANAEEPDVTPHVPVDDVLIAGVEDSNSNSGGRTNTPSAFSLGSPLSPAL